MMTSFLVVQAFLERYPELKNAGISFETPGETTYVYDSHRDHIGTIDANGVITLTVSGDKLLQSRRTGF